MKPTLTEILASIIMRADEATEGPWQDIPGDSYCAYPAVTTPNKQFIFEDHEGHEPGECPRKCDGGFPGPERGENMSLDVYLTNTIYSSNITHNLNKMAEAAGIYEALWRPDEIGIYEANQLIPILKGGLERLKKFPDMFKTLNPSNGWGDYDGLVKFVEEYLEACENNPDASVRVSR